MQYPEYISKTAKELGIPAEVISKVFNGYWKEIRDRIALLPLKDHLSEEEFNNLIVNFNLPGIGKLYSSYDIYLRAQKAKEYASRKNTK